LVERSNRSRDASPAQIVHKTVPNRSQALRWRLSEAANVRAKDFDWEKGLEIGLPHIWRYWRLCIGLVSNHLFSTSKCCILWALVGSSEHHASFPPITDLVSELGKNIDRLHEGLCNIQGNGQLLGIRILHCVRSGIAKGPHRMKIVSLGLGEYSLRHQIIDFIFEITPSAFLIVADGLYHGSNTYPGQYVQ
jgi:hypothetical protein